MNHNIELYQEPLKIKQFLSEDNAEMTELQHSLLCGLIKSYRPKKIVEVGVASGATTAILLNCMSMLNLDTVLHSVDIAEFFYRDLTKRTGYLAEECKTLLNSQIDHRTYFNNGKVLPEYLDEIGNDIDFLILDTVHSLPGEILDFLATLPKLKDGAVVVLHDVFLNHANESRTDYAYATRTLLSAVAADKIIGRGDDNPYHYIELGVFIITDDTRKYIENVFSSLIITWHNMPTTRELEVYRKWFSQYYCPDLIEEFDVAVAMNRNTLQNKKRIFADAFRNTHELINKLESQNKIYIYGCGTYGMKLYGLLDRCGIKIEGFVISDSQVKPSITQKVKHISDINSNDNTIIMGMSIELQKTICKGTMPDNWLGIDENIIAFLNNFPTVS